MKFGKWKLAFWLGSVLALFLALMPVAFGFFGLDVGPNLRVSVPVKHSLEVPTPTPIAVSDLTVDKIMAWSRNEKEVDLDKVPQTEVVKLLIAGDVMLGGAVNFNMHRKDDFDYPLLKVGKELREADITMVSLEMPILGECPLSGDGMQLCADPLSLNTLMNAGIDVVNLANNHIGDFGISGISETKEWLNTRGILDVGLGFPVVRNVRGVRFGFLGFDGVLPVVKGVDKATQENVRKKILDLKSEVDVVVVGFHWGDEYRAYPNASQKLLARVAIDAGADVVWGSHPHWVQGIEVYKGKPIFYSLGNFVFDQMQSKETREGLAVELTYYKDALRQVKLMPIFMNDFAQPVWQPVGYNSSILKKIESLSFK